MNTIDTYIAELKTKTELTETITGAGDAIVIDVMYNNKDSEPQFVKVGPGNEEDIVNSLKKHFENVETLAIQDVPGGEGNSKPKGRGRVSE